MRVDTSNLLNRLRTSLGEERWLAVHAVATAAEPGRAYLNGGGVRDLLLGREPDRTDLDVTVVGVDARDVARAAAEGRDLSVHDAFLTATWWHDGFHVDVVTARSELYTEPGALPTVTPGTLEQDLARRDFTINAMVIDLRSGELVDLHGGVADMEAGRVRALHAGSFRDDPTRVFRAARYGGRFGFEVVDPVHGVDVRSVGWDRLVAELDRVFREPEPHRALRLLGGWGVLAAAFPGWTPDLELSARIGGHRLAQWAAVCGGDEGVAAGLRLGAELRKLARATPRDLDRWIAQLPTDHGRLGEALHGRPEPVLRLLRAAGADPARLDWWEQVGRHRACAIGGDELRERGHTPGPRFAPALAAARRAAWAGQDPSGQLLAAERVMVGDDEAAGGSHP